MSPPRKSQARILGVTGTPGAGKKSVAPLVARRLGLRCVGLNELARTYGLLAGSDREGEVDTAEMRRRLADEFRGDALVYGHLLPYVLGRSSVARVAVLRCEPGVLRDRLMARLYPPRKVVDNVEAELIGLVSSDAFRAYGESKAFEVDTTRSTAEEAAEAVALVMSGRAEPGPRADWTSSYDSGAKLRSLLSVGR